MQSEATQLPFIFLSAGVSATMFQETLKFAKKQVPRLMESYVVAQLGQTACFHLFNKVQKQPLRGLKQLVKQMLTN